MVINLISILYLPTTVLSVKKCTVLVRRWLQWTNSTGAHEPASICHAQILQSGFDKELFDRKIDEGAQPRRHEAG